MTVHKIVNTRISEVFVRDDGILQINIAPNKDFIISDYEELMSAAKEIGNGEKFLNLIVVGDSTLVDNETRIVSCSEEGSQYKKADAFVIQSLAQALIMNFYIKFNKPFVPTHFFKKEEDALEWLQQFRD